MTKVSNEGKTCDAVIRIIEERTGGSRADVCFPDKDHCGPPVDVRLRIGASVYAIEHTLIEAFEGQITKEVQFATLIEPIVRELSGRLPSPGRYYLTFPIDTRLGAKQNEIGAIQRRLVHWVQDRAEHLYVEQPVRGSKSEQPFGYEARCTEVPQGVPFEVTLTRRLHWNDTTRHEGFLFPMRSGPGDVEAMRRSRIAGALARKCPKLKRCKDGGAISILVLEESDIAFSDHLSIGDALGQSLAARNDHPDEIFLVSTVVPPWTIWSVVRGDTLFPAEGLVEFDPAHLVDLTGSG